MPPIEYASSFGDTDALAALYAAAELGQRTAEQIATAFRHSRYAVFALEDGRLVGAGRAFGDEVDCAVICDLAVHPSMQGRGLGDSILEMLRHKVRHHRRIILYARPGKEAFYLKRGFRFMKTAMLSSFIVPEERNREAGIIE